MDELTRLARVAASGDQYALGSFIRLSQGDVWTLCASLVDRSSADDLTQETYLRAMRSLPRFRGDSSARTWLLTIAHHTCVDAIRRRIRRRSVMADLVPAEAVEPDSSVVIDHLDLIDRLTDERREAFVLTQLTGLSYEDAATVAGCAVGTIRSRVSRARRDLRVMLQADGEGEAERTA